MEDPAPMEILACRPCRKLCRYLPVGTTSGNGHLGTVLGGAGTTEEKNWWKRGNPQTHFQKDDVNRHAQWGMYNRAWRSTSPVSLQIKAMFNGLEAAFSVGHVSELAKRGGAIVRDQGGIYQALCCVQEPEMRLMWPQLHFIEQHAHMFPDR